MSEFRDYQWRQYMRAREWSQTNRNVAGGICIDALRIRRYSKQDNERLVDRLHDVAESYEANARDAAYLASELLELWRRGR